MVFSVKLHFGLIPYPLPPYPLSLIPTPWSLSTSAVPFKKFRWGLFLLLSVGINYPLLDHWVPVHKNIKSK